ncbi:MAG: hypothetical protein AAF420_02865 [Pseudomonadota bacterium]
MLEAQNEADAVEELHRLGCTDGLPVVVPTPDRVVAMVSRVDLDPDLSLGEMGPKRGSATVEKVAAAAVMAGCLPDHFPVVIAAVRAVCQDAFDLTEVNQTTHCLAPLIVVNGPARHDCGPIESGFGILGPGNRAAACIGRALSLAIINIGGRKSGESDLAIFSTPGKFTACFAEAEEQSPFEPWHVANGFGADDSVATVIGVEAPQSVILESIGDPERDAQRLISVIARAIANPANNHAYCGGRAAVVVVLNPEHAAMLSRAGYKRDDICSSISTSAAIPRVEADSIFAGLNLGDDNDGDTVPAIRAADQIALFVAGGVGTYSMVLPTWAYAPHGNFPVSEMITVSPHCDLPFAQ